MRRISGGRSADRCIRKLEGMSESRSPVTRPAPTVGHGDDLDVVAVKDVHQIERVSWQHVPSGAAAIARPGPGICSNGVDGVS
jgi:hypothetical protein